MQLILRYFIVPLPSLPVLASQKPSGDETDSGLEVSN